MGPDPRPPLFFIFHPSLKGPCAHPRPRTSSLALLWGPPGPHVLSFSSCIKTAAPTSKLDTMLLLGRLHELIQTAVSYSYAAAIAFCSYPVIRPFPISCHHALCVHTVICRLYSRTTAVSDAA